MILAAFIHWSECISKAIFPTNLKSFALPTITLSMLCVYSNSIKGVLDVPGMLD